MTLNAQKVYQGTLLYAHEGANRPQTVLGQEKLDQNV